MVIETLRFWKTFLYNKESLTLQDKQLGRMRGQAGECKGTSRSSYTGGGHTETGWLFLHRSRAPSVLGTQRRGSEVLVVNVSCFALHRWHGVRTLYAAALLLKPPASRRGAENENSALP